MLRVLFLFLCVCEQNKDVKKAILSGPTKTSNFQYHFGDETQLTTTAVEYFFQK